MSRADTFEEASDSFSSYYRGYVDVEQRTPGTYRKRDLDALKVKGRQSGSSDVDVGAGRTNLGFEQEPVIFARRNPPAYELELIGQLIALQKPNPFCECQTLSTSRSLCIWLISKTARTRGSNLWTASHLNRWLCCSVMHHSTLAHSHPKALA